MLDNDLRKKIGFSRSRRRKKRRLQAIDKKNLTSWIVQILIVMVIAAVLVIYFGQKVSNQGESMNPVVKNGDVVLTNRIIYDISRPQRGDVIAFQPNGNDNASYRIRRIIGLPGETVQLKDGVVFINGEQLLEEYDTTSIDDVGIAGEEIQLAGDEYFVLGDNRSPVDDSRQANIGNVKREEIYGKAWFVIESKNNNFGFVK